MISCLTTNAGCGTRKPRPRRGGAGAPTSSSACLRDRQSKCTADITGFATALSPATSSKEGPLQDVAHRTAWFARAHLLTALSLRSMPTRAALCSLAPSPQLHGIWTSVENCSHASCCTMPRRAACELKQLHLWRRSCERSRRIGSNGAEPFPPVAAAGPAPSAVAVSSSLPLARLRFEGGGGIFVAGKKSPWSSCRSQGVGCPVRVLDSQGQ